MTHQPTIIIRRAELADASLLTQIAFAAKRRWSYPESWIESWRAALTITPASIAADDTHVAIADERIVGFYALHKDDGKLELLHLWVVPEWMGCGIGRSLFIHAVARAKEAGAPQLKIESDPNAVGFYLRLGARRVGSRITRVQGQPRKLPVLTYELRRAL